MYHEKRCNVIHKVFDGDSFKELLSQRLDSDLDIEHAAQSADVEGEEEEEDQEADGTEPSRDADSDNNLAT